MSKGFSRRTVKISNEKGVLFIEIMIAVTILMFTGIAALKAFILGTELTKVNSHKIVAMQFAQDRAEDVKEADYVDVTAGNYPADTVTLDTSNSASIVDDLTAARTVTIVNNGITKEVTVAVTWTWQGKTYNETIVTIIAQTS